MNGKKVKESQDRKGAGKMHDFMCISCFSKYFEEKMKNLK